MPVEGHLLASPSTFDHDAKVAENRKTLRVPVEIKVDYRTVGRFLSDYATNISQGGLFVHTCMPLAPGERVRLRLSMAHDEAPFAIDGIVKWTTQKDDEVNHPPGMGIEFIDFDDELRAKVEALLRASSET